MEKIETELTIKMTKHQLCIIRNACIEASKRWIGFARKDIADIAKELTQIIEK